MSKTRQIEILVGAFMAAGFLALFFLAMQVSNLGTVHTGDSYCTAPMLTVDEELQERLQPAVLEVEAPALQVRLDVHVVGRWMILAALVGLVAGLGAVAFYFATNTVDHWVLGEWARYSPPEEGLPAHLPETLVDGLGMGHRWFLFLLPALGGLVSGALVYTFAPEAEGHGTDAAIDAFHNKGGVIRSRVPIVKALASVATIGTGGSAGRFSCSQSRQYWRNSACSWVSLRALSAMLSLLGSVVWRFFVSGRGG